MCDSPLPPPARSRSILTICPLHGRTGLVLAGEADLTVQDMLCTALAALPADGTSDIHLDLTGLRFIDVACARELVALTGRHPAVRLIVHHPPASLLRIIALLYPEARMELTGTPCPHRTHANLRPAGWAGTDAGHQRSRRDVRGSSPRSPSSAD
jgi:anti-anti-sigma regulatory factor